MAEPSGASVAEPSCPKCGETPMFRSVVHECCEVAGRLNEQVAAVLALRRATAQGTYDGYAQGYNAALDEVRGLLAKAETEAHGG